MTAPRGAATGRVAVAAMVVGASCAGAAPASGTDDAMARGRALFAGGAQPACAICHTLADAGAQGTVGPSLDEVRPDAARVERALREGFGAMPSYAESLSAAQRRTLAEYVAAASGGAR